MEIGSSDRCAVAQQQCKDTHCFWQSAIGPCSVLLCKRGWQQACATANTPMDICSSDRCAVAQQQCKDTHCFWQSAIAPCSVLLCKRGWQQACATANTPMEIGSSDRCAVAQQQSSATLLLAKCNCPLLGAAVQNRLTVLQSFMRSQKLLGVHAVIGKADHIIP